MSEAQRLAADPGVSVFVTANAGSGKTKTLVDRVARLLLKGVEPDRILCVTYTKAAAAEMQRRLFDQLGAWALAPADRLAAELAKLEGEPPAAYDAGALSAARKLFARALETPGGLKIQTIHAFCEKLLRRFPLEAGVSPGFTVLDDATAAEVVGEARDRVAERALAGEPLLSEAYSRFAVVLDFMAFEAMFAAFESRREAIFAFTDRCGGLAGLPQAVAEACGLPQMMDAEEIQARAVTPPALDPALWRMGAEVLAAAGGARDAKNALQMAAVAEAAVAGDADFRAALRVFCTAEGQPAAWLAASKALKERPDLQTRLVLERDRLLDADALARSARVADDTVQALVLAFFYAQAYRTAKAARGGLDFTDLIARTVDLLTRDASAAWVLYKLDAGLEHILVDEAQDTAPDQWAVIDALTGEFFSGAGRDAGERVLERGVFVVGDEKQSIFSFQGAVPERLAAQAELYRVQAEGAGRRFARVPLVESWRSTLEVLAFVDAVFQPDEMRERLQPRARSSTAAGGDAAEGEAESAILHVANRADGPGTIDLWELEREPEAEDRRAWDEPLDAGARRGAWRVLAERIAGEIRALVARGDGVFDKEARVWRPAGFGDVIVLVRKRGALFEELLRACKRAGVPVAGADRLKLSAHPVFEDFLALARFALFDGDDLSLAALLRSPFCDLSDDDLFALAHGRKATLWAELARRGDEQPHWAAARAFLGWAKAEGLARPPFDFYGRVLSRLDPVGRSMRARFATRLGPEAGDAVEAFLAQALAAEHRGVHDLERFADGLSRLAVTVKREMDEPRGEVRVMTAHGAKGLEAPIVFLPETVGASGGRGSPLLETEGGGFLWCGSSGGDCDASAAARDWRKRREEAESFRLLYVALTRARDRLVIAGRVSATAKVENLKGWFPALSAAFDRLGDQVRTLEIDGCPVRRYGADPRTPPAGAAPEGAAPPSLPAWALAPVPPEPAAPAYAAPSTLGEDDPGPAPSPLARAAGLGRYRRGTLIHRLLQLLPDLDPAQRAAGAARLLLKERDLDQAQRAEMAGAALAVLNDPVFAEVFAPGSRAEAAVAGTAPELDGLMVSGRVDRMRVEPNRVLVVDFKTNRPAPASIEAADPAYVLQMAVYWAVLRQVFPGRRIETALVWTDGPRLMPIPEAVMAESLANRRRRG